MEKFKIEIWEKEGLNINFRPLNDIYIKKIIKNINKKNNIPIFNHSHTSFFEELLKYMHYELIFLEINMSQGFKELISLLNLNLSENDYVDVIWNYNEAEQFKYNILADYWEYIWYGASDEMCLIFIPNIEFPFVVTDYGTIYY